MASGEHPTGRRRPASTAPRVTPSRGERPTATERAALGHRFTVVTDVPGLQGYLGELFASLDPGDTPSRASDHREATPATYTLRAEPGSQGRTASLWRDETLLCDPSPTAHAVALLLWDLNQQAVVRSPHLVRVHAAALADHGHGLVLAAPMEGGKTTLAAALVEAGFAYLSDEIAAFDPATLALRAYPKPLSVDPGSWAALAHLEPHVDPDLAPLLPRQWQLPAQAIRPGAVTATADPRLVLVIRYDPDTDAAPQRLPRSKAVAHLARSTFELDRNPDRDLSALADIVRRCDCYTLAVGDLARACAEITALLPSDPATAEAPP